VTLSLVVLALAGCAVDQVDEVSAPRPAVTPSPVAPIPSPIPEPEVTTAMISTEGYGYITIGQPVPEAYDGPALVQWDEGACAPFSGAWREVVADGQIPSLTLDQTSDFTRSGAVTTMVVGGPGGPHTDRGITVGSSEAELWAAYPQMETVIAPSDGWAQYSVTGSAGRLGFFIENGSVLQIGVFALSIPIEQTRIGPTDWYGPCS